MAEQGQKVISYAFKEIRLADLNELSKVTQVESEKFRRQLEVDLIYLCTFGMADPPRPGIAKSIHLSDTVIPVRSAKLMMERTTVQAESMCAWSLVTILQLPRQLLWHVVFADRTKRTLLVSPLLVKSSGAQLEVTQRFGTQSIRSSELSSWTREALTRSRGD
jgi:hypothetical protein